MKSWFALQNIVKEEKDGSTEIDSTRLEYLLNFLGNTGHNKYERWQPPGTDDKVKKTKASADKFMDYLLSLLDHEVSQCCRIYQLEDVRIRARKSPHGNACMPWLTAAISQLMMKRNVMYSTALFASLVTSI